MTIHAYLTLPVGVEAKNLPLVEYVHGGPWWHWSWGLDSYAQLFANRGYAVLEVNYRGSTGYGKKYRRTGDRQWGRAMQDDLTDSVRWRSPRVLPIPIESRLTDYLTGARQPSLAPLSRRTSTDVRWMCADLLTCSF
jgi:hypothetical protein